MPPPILTPLTSRYLLHTVFSASHRLARHPKPLALSSMSFPATSSRSKHSAYAKWTDPSQSPSPIAPPPPIIPYRAPPRSELPAPTLPRRPHLEPPPGWVRTSHIVPAAYPRRFAECFGSHSRDSSPFEIVAAEEGETKEERMARMEGEARETLRRRWDAEPWVEGRRDEGLYIAAERWVRKKEGGGRVSRGAGVDSFQTETGVTLVVTHANGFTKESWHPTLRRLLQQPSISGGTESFGERSAFSSSSTGKGMPSPIPSSIRVEEVWLLDDVHHATSIDVNAGRLGAVHGWSDGGRDVINFVEHIWPGSEASLPDEQLLEWKEGNCGGRRRKVIGVGHSFGGNALVQAAYERPDLFHALFLAEPMCPGVAPPRSSIDIQTVSRRWPLVLGATKRRTTWSSLAEVSKLRKTPFFANWHPEVWELYLSHGIIPVDPGKPEGAVTLATPNWAEAAVFAEPTGLGEGWDRLQDLKMPVGFLMGGQPEMMYGAKIVREMVWRAPLSSNERIDDGGHLLVQERPDDVADALYRFISSISGRITENETGHKHHMAEEPKARL